jgi:hypothetical protein
LFEEIEHQFAEAKIQNGGVSASARSACASSTPCPFAPTTGRFLYLFSANSVSLRRKPEAYGCFRSGRADKKYLAREDGLGFRAFGTING